MINTINLPACISKDMVYINERKSYIQIPNSFINTILAISNLSDLEKLYYLLTDLYAHLGKKIKGLREA
ncbi:MAG: hypothetical protein ACR2HS_04245, partial [Gammaproteobacteria bacterium]